MTKNQTDPVSVVIKLKNDFGKSPDVLNHVFASLASMPGMGPYEKISDKSVLAVMDSKTVKYFGMDERVRARVLPRVA